MDPRASCTPRGDGAGARLHGLALRQPPARFRDDARHRGVIAGAMMWTPATPGMAASSSISSTRCACPSAAGSAAPSSRSTCRVGDDGAEQVLLHPARRLRRAQRRDRRSAWNKPARRLVLGEPRDIAAHHAGIHAELGLRELGAGGDLGGELVAAASPGGGSIGSVGGAEEEVARAPATLRPVGSSPLSRMSRAPWRSASPSRRRTPPWCPAGRRPSDRRR